MHRKDDFYQRLLILMGNQLELWVFVFPGNQHMYQQEIKIVNCGKNICHIFRLLKDFCKTERMVFK